MRVHLTKLLKLLSFLVQFSNKIFLYSILKIEFLCSLKFFTGLKFRLIKLFL